MKRQPCLMVVHAHPDDEVFSTGGIIARYSAAGYRVVVVYATNGEAGEMHDPDLDPADAIPRLGEIRQEEARRACAILGATDIYFLGYRDSGMRDTEENKHSDAFMNVPLQQAVDQLLGIMRDTYPDVLVTYDTDGGYGHPDHVQTHQLGVAAFEQAQGEPWAPRKLYYSARSRESFAKYLKQLAAMGVQVPWVREDFNIEEFGMPDAEITAHVDISRFTPLKKRALAEHRTQIKGDHFYLSIPDETLSESSGTETFLRIQPPAEGKREEDDLFAGLDERGEQVA
ncbi:MAG: PIG-L family deacetylase [Chloroflexota bacterium]